VIAKSSNLGIIVAARHMTKRSHWEYLRKFGFGQLTGIGLAGETAGILRDGDQWAAANRATIAFGQGISVNAVQIVRAVGATDTGMDLEQEGDEAVIDVGAHVTNICVHSRGLTRFVRILPSGGRDVTLAIARSLGVEDEVAERLKKGEEVEGAPAQEDVRRAAMSRAGSFVNGDVLTVDGGMSIAM